MVAGYATRVLGVVLTIIYLLTSTVACGGMEEDPVSRTTTGIPIGVSSLGASTTVSILQSRPEISFALQGATERYAASSGKRVTFTVQTVSDPWEYRTALRSRMAAGNTPDLFHLLSAGDAVELGSRLEPLESLPWIHDTRGNLLDSVTTDQQILGVPYALEGTGLVVNRKIFEAAGISLSQIGDFESMSEAFYELRGQIADGVLEDSFPQLEAVTNLAGLDSGWMGSTLGELLLTESVRTPIQAYSATSVRLPVGEFTGSYVELLARCSPHSQKWSDLIKVSQNQLVGAMADQQIAAALLTTEAAAQILEESPHLADILDFLPIYLEGIEEGILYTGTSAWWAVSADASQPVRTGAKDFLTWLYTSPEGNATLLEEFGAISPYHSQKPANMPLLEKRLLAALEGETSLPRLTQEAPAFFQEEILAPQLRQYFSDYDKEWAQVTRACEEGWANLRSQR